MSDNRYQIPKEKVAQLEILLTQNCVDCMVIIARENTDDMLRFLIGSNAIHQCIAIFNKNGEHVMIASASDEKKYIEPNIFKKVIVYTSSLWEEFIKVINEMNPNKIALSISKEDGNADGLTLGQYFQLEQALGKKRLDSLQTSSELFCRELRSVKTDAEITALHKCIDTTTEIYDRVFSQIRCGMKETEIGDLFIDAFQHFGVANGIGDLYSYPIVCIVRAGLAHRSPGATKLAEGDIVIMDLSVLQDGYVSDIARTGYCLRKGETSPPEDIQHAFDTAYKAITETINFISAGKKGYEVDAVGRSVVEAHGYPTVRHSVGHPIGTSCHDSGTRLGPLREGGDNKSVERVIGLNEVYAIEPTIIQDNQLPCMLVEENVVIKEDGAKVLSRRQTQLYLIPSGE